jgi:hypothetical protein
LFVGIAENRLDPVENGMQVTIFKDNMSNVTKSDKGKTKTRIDAFVELFSVKLAIVGRQ